MKQYLPSMRQLRPLCFLAAAGLAATGPARTKNLGRYLYHSDVPRADRRDVVTVGAGGRRRRPRHVAVEYAGGRIVGVRPFKSIRRRYKRTDKEGIPGTGDRRRGRQQEAPERKLRGRDRNATNHVGDEDGDDANDDAPGGKNRCEPMHDWQLGSFPNCNDFHEVDVAKMRVINTGGFKIAFEMSERVDGKQAKYAYKTIKWEGNINRPSLELQRRDGIVMERTTKSKFIPDIHGFCAVAAFMDYMPEGNMHDYIKGARLAGGSALAPADKLRVAIHIASAVADLHTIDGTDTPSFFHNDLFPHQYLFQDGLFKLNDFHIAKPILVNRATRLPCPRTGFGVQVRKRRTLEQHQQRLNHPDFRPVLPDKTDVWMMGNIIYTVLTDLYLFEEPRNLNCTEAGIEMVNGRRSPLPDRIRNSADPSHLAMRRALDMCWTQDSRERPSARAVADYLTGELRGIEGEDRPDLRVTLPGRDEGQSLTSSDYNRFNYDWAMTSDGTSVDLPDAAGNATRPKGKSKKMPKKKEAQLVKKIREKLKYGEDLDSGEEEFALEKDLI